MARKTKRPSVKIPASVLRKEAQKAAKKMLAAEQKKERQKALREKAKTQAKKKVERQRQKAESHSEFFDDTLRQEIWGGVWIVLAVILVAIFASAATAAQDVFVFFRKLFGVGTWLIPLVFLAVGVVLLRSSKEKPLFPPIRIAALMGVFVCFLGVANLFVSHADSLALAHEFGGAVGFAIGYFPREIFGTAVTAVLFVGLGWLCAMAGFRLSFSQLFSWGKGVTASASGDRETSKSQETKSTTEDSKKSGEALTPRERFKNELEIVDSSQNQKKNGVGKKIELEDEDALTEAKNAPPSGEWAPPDLELLRENDSTITVDETLLRENAQKIQEKLFQFGIDVTMKSVHVGPTVTQFTLEPAPGVKLTKITALKSDLALTLAAENIRIEAPIRGKSLVGIEIPNKKRAIVGMREMIESDTWEELDAPLKLAVGRDVAGKPIMMDLARMPHLLIAGKTGSGKSVAMNAFLTSLLWNNSPEDLRLILIDPKRVELKPYNHLPHLLTPVIVEPEKAVSALAWAVAEMNRRYRKLSAASVRNIQELNAKKPDEKEPFIVIVIDELADLMMVAGKDVEAAVCRIAQLARAVGLHLMIATQRPSVDVVTGLIKANLPARIAFRVSSQVDSRTIIDGIGAEDLLGFGDMLMLEGNSGDLIRIQGIYISTEEVERVTNNIKLQFPEMMAQEDVTSESIEGMAKGRVLTAGTEKEEVPDEKLDALFDEAVALVMETKKASASFLQRRLEVGYARAARILDQMESKGIVGPARGAKPREIFGPQ